MSLPRLAVVGVGYLGTIHARILARHPGCVLECVADARPDRAAETARALGVDHCAGAAELPPGLDGVVVAVDTSAHEEVVGACLDRGCRALLVEKPLASTTAGGRRLTRACEDAGVPLLVGHLERFNPVLDTLAPHLDRPGFAEIHRLGAFVPRSLDQDVVVDLMIHDIDLLLHWLGEEVVDVRAVGVSVMTETIDIANARLHFSGGCVANLTASRVSRDKIRKVRIFQHDAYFSLDLQSQEISAFRRLPGKRGPEAVESLELPVAKHPPLDRELDHFLAVCRREADPRVDGRAALAALEVAERIKARL